MRFTFQVGKEELYFIAGRFAEAEAKLCEFLAVHGLGGAAYVFVDAVWVGR